MRYKTLRILYLTDSFNVCCGRSRHIALLAKGLQKQGHNVTVVAAEGDGQYLLRGSDIQVMFYPFLLHQKRSWFNFLRGMFLLAFLQWKYHFDLIHVHCYYQSAMVRLLSKCLRTPHIYTVHGEYVKGKFPLFIGDLLIAVSNQTKQWIIQKSQKWGKKVVTISGGIDMNRDLSSSQEDVRMSLGITQNEFIVSMIGRIVHSKGHKYTITGIIEVTDRYSHCVSHCRRRRRF